MTNWKTLESFEAELLEDTGFRKAHDEQEADYRIAREILAARLAIGLSQKALAKAIGTSQGRISKWESAEEEPRIGTLRRIAAATGRVLVVGLIDDAPGAAPRRGTGRTGRTALRKSTTGSSSGRQRVARKSVGRKSAASKSSAKKSTVRKTTAGKSSTKKSGARKAAVRKSSARKTTARKSTGRKSATQSRARLR